MGQQTKEVDIESLQERSPRRGRCLDSFLVMSISFLFAAMTALTVGGVMAVMQLRSEVNSLVPSSSLERSMLKGPPSSPVYKMEKFAYLEANSSILENSTMQWTQIPYAEGTSVGSDFLFDPVQHSLKPILDGTYFMYLDLHFTCTSSCSSGVVTVSVDDELTCKVELQEKLPSVSKKCWTVHQLHNKRLLTQMTVPKEGMNNWKLEGKGSGFGIFLIDP